MRRTVAAVLVTVVVATCTGVDSGEEFPAANEFRDAVAERRLAHVVDSDPDLDLQPLEAQELVHDVALPSAVSAVGDNAAMESFFALLQKNVLNRHSWAIRDELRLAIITWIERTYHRRRRQRALGKLTPVEFEAIIGNTDLAQAA